MDPVTHTLTGVALGRAGLRRTTPLAMAALFLGANAPDVDIIASFIGADAALGFRRGWTHGPLGLLVLPMALMGLLWIWHRLTSKPDDPPVRWGRLLGIAYVATFTHPLLDWLNTYGIRYLMPFSDTWHYGDAVFIVDPWIWLMLACPVMLASTRTWAGRGLWLLGAGVATALIVWVPLVPVPARMVWLGGVAILIVLRMRRSSSRDVVRIARGALALAVLYMGMNLLGTSLARRQAASMHERPIAAVVMAGPLPANPFRREIVFSEGGEGGGGGGTLYEVQTIDWLKGRAVNAIESFPVLDGPEARAAMAAPGLAGYAHWARFPTYRVSETGSGYRVDIVDVRYARLTGDGFGTATVFLDADLEPLSTEVR